MSALKYELDAEDWHVPESLPRDPYLWSWKMSKRADEVGIDQTKVEEDIAEDKAQVEAE